MKLILAGVVTLLCSGCLTGPQGPSAKDRLRELSFAEIGNHAEYNDKFLQSNTEQALIDASLEAARNQLKDPGSAEFRYVGLVQHARGKVVCGQINAKNSYGGYVGYKVFAASPLGATVQQSGGSYAEVDAIANSGLRATCVY
jgi:hypothetical protein